MDLAHTSDIALQVSKIPVSYDEHIQRILNIENRTRTSVLPWRGQFSPQLIEYLLTHHATPGSLVVDPFCGSGTTLFEAAAKGHFSYGLDVNPAAYILASASTLLTLNASDRQELVNKCRKDLMRLSTPNGDDLFSTTHTSSNSNAAAYDFMSHSGHSLEQNIFYHLVLMMAYGDKNECTSVQLWKALKNLSDMMITLPVTSIKGTSLLADARHLPFDDGQVDIIITSPPYINVFNYHQNYRKVMEVIGWRPLEVAVSEIGANRKHRMNRFLTVVQYCMDMAASLVEMKRVLHDDANAIIVVGRTSSVRSVPFRNSQLLAMVAEGAAGFSVEKWQERVFTNRFGEKIYEDILTLKATGTPIKGYLEFARLTGLWALHTALPQTSGEIRGDILAAIDGAAALRISPPLSVRPPTHHASVIRPLSTERDRLSAQMI